MRGIFSGAQHPLPELTHSAIHIVRDPRDVTVSYANHYGHTVSDAAQMLQREDNHTREQGHPFRKAVLGSWQMNVTSWLEAPFPVMTIRYEDMLDHPSKAVGDVLSFLKMKPAMPVEEIVRMTSFKNCRAWSVLTDSSRNRVTSHDFSIRGGPGSGETTRVM